eukprot:gene9531-9694_t
MQVSQEEAGGKLVGSWITLTKVFKKQKAGAGSSSAAAAATAIASFRKRLQRYCSEMGAKFVDYQPDDGVWIFEAYEQYDQQQQQSDVRRGGPAMAGSGKGASPGMSQEPELTFGDTRVTVNITMSIISQLLLLGPPTSTWSTFVALHLPDAVSDDVSVVNSDGAVVGAGAARAAAVQQLLCLTAGQWAEENEIIAWMRERMLLPLPWLHDAQDSCAAQGLALYYPDSIVEARDVAAWVSGSE